MRLLANRYRLDAPLGAGGMGQVLLAFDTVLERQVAVKLLSGDSASDLRARERLRREALAAAALDHPYICKIHEVGEDDGRPFIVMERIEGRTLDQVLHGELTPRQWLDCAHEIAQALDEAHRRGLVHRDLKPSNVMLTVHGHVKVLDFGLAKQVDVPNGGQAATATGLTDAGTRLGTPAYMSPEQVLGSPLDPRSDIFSLGVVLHEIAGGGHPFQRASAAETMAAILRDPPAATEGDLDLVPGFGRVVHRMLAKACAERYQSMRELRADLEALRDASQVSTLAAGLAGGRAEVVERSAFVARDSELGELTAHLDRMLVGHGGLVLLGGEPGVGKTRLAREMQRLARARGCFTLTGQSYEQEGAPPFGPIAETVEQAVRLVPQAVRAALGELAPEVAAIAPALRRVFPDIGDPPAVPADQQRRLLFNAYLDYVQRGARKSATVVLLDDLHWADDSTLQLLLHLAPHLSAMRLLIVGTYRDVELDTQRPFARALETLLRQRLATRIALRRLDMTGVEQMLSTMSGSPPPSGLVRVVHQETDGNPFFVEEVFQHLAEEGKLFDDAGRWKANLKADEIDVPEGVRLVISRRLDRLGDDARRVLTGAAVIGRSFPLDLLLAVTEGGEDTVLDILESAEKAHLLRAERGREPRYTFVHELIRATLVGGMALPRRQRLHAKIADAIERLRAASMDAHESMLAHHLYQAGAAVDTERTIAALGAASRTAMAAGAYEEVLGLVEQLRSLDLAPNCDTRATADETDAHALIGLGRPGDAVTPAKRALEWWIVQRVDAGIYRTADLLANAHVWSGDVVTGNRLLERALQALSEHVSIERATLSARLAIWLTHENRLSEAISLRDTALASLPALGSGPEVGYVYYALSEGARQLGHVAEALRLNAEALPRLRGMNVWVEAYAYLFQALNLAYAGQYERLPEVCDQALELAARAGNPGGAWIVRQVTNSRTLIRTGDLALFRDTALRDMDDASAGPFRIAAALRAAGAMHWLGDTDGASAQLKSQIRTTTTLDDLPEFALACLAAWKGDVASARRPMEAADRLTARAGTHHRLGSWFGLAMMVSAWSLLGERTRAAAHYPAIQEFVGFGSVLDVTSLGPSLTPLSAGTAASAADLPDRAAAHFADAHAVADRLDSPILRPLADLWHGKHLRDLGPGTRLEGEARLRAAAQGFSAIKAPLHEELARRWLSEVSPR